MVTDLIKTIRRYRKYIFIACVIIAFFLQPKYTLVCSLSGESAVLRQTLLGNTLYVKRRKEKLYDLVGEYFKENHYKNAWFKVGSFRESTGWISILATPLGGFGPGERKMNYLLGSQHRFVSRVESLIRFTNMDLVDFMKSEYIANGFEEIQLPKNLKIEHTNWSFYQ